MKKLTLLEQAINGREVITYVEGKYRPNDKRSNLYKAIKACGYNPIDLGSETPIH